MSHAHDILPTPSLPTTRREFLRLTSRGVGLLAFAHYAPSFLVNSTLAATPAPERDRSILVLVQLAGGNDGLNTVVPFADDNYHRLRPTLGLKADQVLRLDDHVGLHPACAGLHGLFHEGQLAVVRNVGYPNPNRSHFRSAEIWETAAGSSEYLGTGWIGRYLDHACAGAPAGGDPAAVHITNGLPQTFTAAQEHPTFGLMPNARPAREGKRDLELLEQLSTAGAANDNASYLQHTLMDSLVTEKRVQRILGEYRPESAYPGGAFAASLRNVAALVAAGLSTRIYYVSLSGFDTHSNQANQHQNLLRTLSEGLAAFQQDLRSRGLDDQVLTMTFSEFGRRPSENESRGTDHGTAAPLFVMGSRIKGGLHGGAPSLAIPRNLDIAFSTDFRQVYATMLEDWLACPAAAVLDSPMEKLALV